MPQPLSGPGVGLPINQNLYPHELQNAPYDTATNRVCLAPGQSIQLPAGDFYVSLGFYLFLQFLDPVTNAWVTGASGGWEGPIQFVKSDGFNVRIANMLCCPIGGVVTQYGSGYVQASTSISVTGGGGSTWLPIVGGQLTLVGGTLTANGAGYGVAPLVFIDPPPAAANNANGVGGIQASGYCVIANGTVSGFTFTNPGAGYPSAPNAVVVPSPFDPNLSTGITAATITFSLTGSGSITGVRCTNSGAPLSNPANITLTVSGVGTNATVTPIIPRTTTTVSLTGTGLGWGTTTGLITSVGGAPPTGTVTNSPDFLGIGYKPRPLQASVAVTNLGTVANQVGTIIDGGMFYNTPTPVQLPGAQAGQSGSIVGSTIALTMGSTNDIAVIQQAP